MSEKTKMEYRRRQQQRHYQEIRPEGQTEKETSATSKSTMATVKHGKCRSAIDFLKERWRGDVVHNPLTQSHHSPESSFPTASASSRKPVRRCLSQPARGMGTADSDGRCIVPSNFMLPLEGGQRHVSVQCSIIEWNQVEKRVELAADDETGIAFMSSSFPHLASETVDGFSSDYRSRRYLYGCGPTFSSQEISLAATDGSGSTTCCGTEPGSRDNSVDIADGDDNEDADEERAFLKWYMTASSACVHGAPASPPASSQSMAALECVKLAGPGCVPTRVERLRREFRQCRGSASAARSASCQSEPEVVRCCSASTAAAAVVPHIDVEAWRRQFRRRKAITLSDIEVNEALLSHYAGHDDKSISSMSAESVAIAVAATARERSFSQRSAATQHRFKMYL